MEAQASPNDATMADATESPTMMYDAPKALEDPSIPGLSSIYYNHQSILLWQHETGVGECNGEVPVPLDPPTQAEARASTVAGLVDASPFAQEE